MQKSRLNFRHEMFVINIMGKVNQCLLMHPWFTELMPRHQALVRRRASLRSVAAGSFIAYRGQPSTHWIGVHQGLIKLAVYSLDGESCTLCGIPPRGWCGEGSVIKRELRKYDVVALRNSELLMIPAEVFHTLLKESLSFSSFIINHLNERMGLFIFTLQAERLLDVNARVAQAIAQLFHPVLHPQTSMVLELSQKEIGLLTGLSRQRVNRALKNLEALKIIDISYQSVRMLDLPALRDFGLSAL